ncbi:MAG: CASTOR/POLLUX-related putative ion channel [Candidatus Limnocylindrales bacterium]
MDRVTWRDRLRYRFDEFMARGTIALILGLFAISVALIVVVALIVWLSGIATDQELDFPTLLRYGLLRTLDPGTMGGDQGTAGFLLAMFAVTLGGIFVISTLIGILNTGLEGKLAEMRKGRSRVVEREHTVILGWSQQIHTVISEIAAANENQGRRSIVILADRDKVEMEEDIQTRVGSTGRTKIVCRSGSPMDVDDLRIASLASARSIVILAPEGDEPDADVIKSILAITNHPDRRVEPYHIVAEIRDRANVDVARMVGRDEVELILSEEVISRITAQTCRQSGLSVVYAELLDFAGDEIYLSEQPELVGRPFGETLAAFADASVIGLLPAGGTPRLNPPSATVLGTGDRLIVIAGDDDRIHLSVGPAVVVDETILRPASPSVPKPERTLVLGWNRRAPSIIRELDAYVPPGSEIMVVASSGGIEAEIGRLKSGLSAQRIVHRAGDSTDRATIDSLGVQDFDHIIVLCYSDTLDASRADARTLVTLLHLRDIASRLDRDFSIVSEMLDLRDRALAEVARADDFIVSDRLISLMIAQVAESKHLNAVFTELLDPAGSEIYLKPAGDYVALGVALPFAAVVQSARRRNEIAFGYRIAARAEDAAAAYGVSVNPPKRGQITFTAADRVIVLAED